MTDKRFKTNEVGCIVDLKDKHLRNYDEEEIVDLLNDLNDENEQIKTKNNAYIQDIEVFKEENTHLKLENEQLKSDIEYIKQLIKDRIKHYHSYSCIRFSPNEHKGCIGLKMELEKIYDDIDW